MVNSLCMIKADAVKLHQHLKENSSDAESDSSDPDSDSENRPGAAKMSSNNIESEDKSLHISQNHYVP